jgi:predicted metal-dependent hydrolase
VTFFGRKIRPSVEIDLGFKFIIVRSKRKTAAIHITAQGVQVRIPNEVSDEFAMGFLTSKKAWVQTKLEKQSKQIKAAPKLAVGETILWMGVPHLISHEVGKKITLSRQEGLFIVISPTPPTEQKLMSLFEKYFKAQAKIILADKTQNTAEIMRLDHKLSGVRFRRTKSKWGHCTSKGIIQFNWLIMGAPLDVINYLVIHEVAHLKHPNHQPGFWTEVESYCGDYKIHDKWLKENGFRLGWC